MEKVGKVITVIAALLLILCGACMDSDCYITLMKVCVGCVIWILAWAFWNGYLC